MDNYLLVCVAIRFENDGNFSLTHLARLFVAVALDKYQIAVLNRFDSSKIHAQYQKGLEAASQARIKVIRRKDTVATPKREWGILKSRTTAIKNTEIQKIRQIFCRTCKESIEGIG